MLNLGMNTVAILLPNVTVTALTPAHVSDLLFVAERKNVRGQKIAPWEKGEASVKTLSERSFECEA